MIIRTSRQNNACFLALWTIIAIGKQEFTGKTQGKGERLHEKQEAAAEDEELREGAEAFKLATAGPMPAEVPDGEVFNNILPPRRHCHAGASPAFTGGVSGPAAGPDPLFLEQTYPTTDRRLVSEPAAGA